MNITSSDSTFQVLLSIDDSADFGESKKHELAIEGKVILWDPDELGDGEREFVELAESPTWADLVEIAIRMGNHTEDTVHCFLEAVFEITHPEEKARAEAAALEARIDLEGAKFYGFFMGS